MYKVFIEKRMRKSIITSLLFFAVNLSFCQTQLWNNFYKDETNIKLYWQQVIEKNYTLASLIAEIKSSGNFKEIEQVDDKIICQFEPFKPDYERCGYNDLEVPNFITLGLVSGNIIFEVKEGRYRVTIKKIVAYPNLTVFYLNENVAIALEDKVLNRKHELKEDDYMIISNILNQEFQNRVTFEKASTDVW